MTPDQFIDTVLAASDDPTPSNIERLRRALPVVGSRPGGVTFPRAVTDALRHRAEQFPYDPDGRVARRFHREFAQRLRDLLDSMNEPQALEAWRRGLGLAPAPRNRRHPSGAQPPQA